MAGISPKWHGLHDVLCCKTLKKFGVTNMIWARPKIDCPHCMPDSFSHCLSVCLSVCYFTLCLLSSIFVCFPHCLPVVFTACLLFSPSIYSVCLFLLSVFLPVFTVSLLSLLSACCSHCLLFFVFLFCKGWKVSRIAKLKLKPQHIFGGNYLTLMSKSTSV